MNKLLLTGFLCVLYLVNPNANAKEKITWAKWELTPEYIGHGEYKDQGYLDKFLVYVQSQLSEYEHENQFQTADRLERSWSNGNTCTVHLWLGFWPEKIVYSKPYGFTAPFGIVTKAASPLAKILDIQQSTSLKHILKNTDYKLGTLPLTSSSSKNARYPPLHSTLEPYLKTGKLIEFRNNRNELSVKLLDYGRADYIVRQRITHHGELKTGKLNNKYKYYSLAEDNNYKLVAAACSNTELGKTVVQKINTLMNDDFYKHYIKYRQEWDVDNAVFEKVYSNYFLKNKANSNITE